MQFLYRFIKYFNGPKLYRVHDILANTGVDYVPNSVEVCGDWVIAVLRTCSAVLKWTSPILLIVMHQRGWFEDEGIYSSVSLAISGFIVYFIAFSIRALGRFTNALYSKFIGDIVRARNEKGGSLEDVIRNYDCDFRAWPVNYKCKTLTNRFRGDNIESASPVKSQPPRPFLTEFALDFLSSLTIHTFGRRLCYPGSLAILQRLMAPNLTKGRAVLVEEKGGQRNKLRTMDGNDIDTMFVDRRSHRSASNGDTLVICSEGNAGFYEVGTMVTPLEAGYSVLGWNHPGFWGSTGAPYPSQEHQAIDAVMMFAIERLGFQPEDIVLFAWSIGAYAAAYAARIHPDIKYVVLDATFDHIVHLAKPRMPPSWEPLVSKAIYAHMNLNVADQLSRYPGPVLFIRRSKDEMITTADPTVVASNRGNNLLIQLLKWRYPNIVNDTTTSYIWDYLSVNEEGQERLLRECGFNEDLCESLIQSKLDEENSPSFPLILGLTLTQLQKRQLALFLVLRHMKEFDATHCVPLPAHLFLKPWNVFSPVCETSKI